MSDVKLIIEMKEGTLYAVYSNTPLDYVLLNYDSIEKGKIPHESNQPDGVYPLLHEIYQSTTEPSKSIRGLLQKLKF